MQRQQGQIINAITLGIVLPRNGQPHLHRLDGVKDVPYEVRRTLVNFDISYRIAGRVSPGVTGWDGMGVNEWQCMAMEQH